MHRFHHSIIRPLLQEVHPQTIVEVGIADGKHTKFLLEYVKEHGGMLHAVDPRPTFDAASWQNREAQSFVFHEKRSIDALSQIENPDIVLLDGDHNYYTVTHELQILSGQAKFPLICIHDIDWPYGRRDLYYDPQSIPEQDRHPYRKAGMVPGQQHLAEEGGLNPMLENATIEGGPRNGCRTAIEDFLKTRTDMRFIDIPGFHGLGILVDLHRLTTSGFLGRLISRLQLDEELREHFGAVEKNRIALLYEKGELLKQNKKLSEALREHQFKLSDAIAKSSALEAQYSEARNREEKHQDYSVSVMKERSATEEHVKALERDRTALQETMERQGELINELRSELAQKESGVRGRVSKHWEKLWSEAQSHS